MFPPHKYLHHSQAKALSRNYDTQVHFFFAPQSVFLIGRMYQISQTIAQKIQPNFRAHSARQVI